LNVQFSYNSIVKAAQIAAVFSVVVCLLLLADFARRTPKLPLDSPDYVELRTQLEAEGGEALRPQLRELDASLRAEYFRQRRFTRRGAFLLIGGVAVTLLLGHWAATVRRRLPGPRGEPAPAESVSSERQRSQWAVGGLVLLLLLGTALAPWLLPSRLPTELEGLDGVAHGPPGQSSPQTDGPTPSPTAPAPEELPPTAEQVAANWPSFRGPGGAGISAYTDVPESWDGASGEGIRWKTAVPLPGNGSPVVWENRVFLSGATDQRREVYGFDADSGQLLWQQPVTVPATNGAAPEAASGEPTELEVMEDTGYAAPTPATDGRRVYAMFANGDVAAFDFNGKEIWSKNLGTPNNPYGHAASLTTFQNRLIVQFDQGTADDDLSSLMALQGSTGEIVWQVQREVPASWASPIVAYHEGQARIITAAAPWVIAYAAEDGQEIWRASCLKGDVGPSPIAVDGMVFVANDGADAVAIRDGGEGDVTESHVIWKNDIGMPDICSPLVTDRHLLLVASYGGLICYDRMEGGEPIWEEDLGAMFSSSPSLAGDRIYLIGDDDDGKGWVVRAGSEACERVGENSLGERCLTSPAFQAGRIYLRGEQHLFCIGPQ
jgi:outer membrane protein assembly factor BamB